MKTAIITTTIYVPVLLEDYVKDAKRYKHDAFFVIIGDKKTPPETKIYCNKIKNKYQAEIYYLDIKDQEKYLKKFPELNKHLPYNSVERRNIALVFAFELGADAIITLDDDNFFIAKDFIKLHQVGVYKQMEILSSSTKWLNTCDYLKEEAGRRIYHRGFPLEYRFLKEKVSRRKKNVKIVVNAGFWLGDPDVDALTRLYFPNQPITATAYLKKENFALAKNTYSPFNSQNTAVAREVIPAYYLSPYTGHFDPVKKTFVTNGRYSDVWGSYVVKRIADHLNGYITFGDPLVKQERNPHNYWKDFYNEDSGMRLNIFFTGALRKIKLTKNSYQACYGELTPKLKKQLQKAKLPDADRQFLDKYIEGMEVWVKTFQRLS